MTQGEVIRAYRALDSLMTVQMPIKVAYRLHKLKKILQNAWDFQYEREKQYLEEFHGEVLQNGNVKFEDPEQMRAWTEAMTSLKDMEVNDILFEPVKLPASDDIMVKPETLADLDGFVFLDI